jgi:predicted nucleic acid-binding protein
LKVVCNTSPLILLAKIHRLGLLAQLYGEVIVPASVLEEMEAKPGNEVEQVRTLLQNRGFRLQRATERTLDEVPPDLGAGEREAIALALEIMADLVILDDQQGRHVAREQGLPVTGTGGILIEAQERRMIPSVRHELDHLIEAGMWIDEAFYHRILQEFGE